MDRYIPVSQGSISACSTFTSVGTSESFVWQMSSLESKGIMRVLFKLMVVRKRNGLQEDWDRHKMVVSLTNAGLSKIEAELTTSLIYESLKTKGIYQVESTVLRSKIITILKCIESNCTDAFEYFSKTPSK